MKLFNKWISIAMTICLALLLVCPSYSYADNELAELEKNISEMNSKQNTPEKVGIVEEKLLEKFGHVVSPSVINKLIKEHTPGEVVTLVIYMKLLDKTDTSVVEMRKSGMGWDKISEKVNISLQKVVKTVKLFRKST